MMTLEAGRSSLLLIDFQEKLMPAIDAAEASVREALRLAQSARLLDVPVLATEQTPDRLGPTIPALSEFAADTLAKSTFDACRGCDIEGALGARQQVVITGWESHVCVLQTAFGLMAAGRRVHVVADAVSSRTPANKAAALARLSAAGAVIVTAEMVIFEWLTDAKNPRFRDVLKLVK
ncbi:isochorismatase family protein [Blastochloris tepida]|jgi:nicotinamidase-related amidase|nr:isochorismatase family protein [Blastochloris tepida]